MENYSDYIEAYFSGALSTEERKEFEKRIEMDKNFAEEVAFYLSAKQVLKEEVIKEKKEWFRQLADQNPDLEKKPAQVRTMWVYRLAAAAAFIGIIFLAWSLFLQQSSPSQMAGAYINSHFDTLPVTMGAQEDDLQNGLRLYNEGQYTAALQQFENILQRDSSNFTAAKYAGVVNLRLAKYDRALAYFQQLEKYSSLFSNPAVFYEALTLLKRNQPGDKKRGKELLQKVVNNDLEGKETAQQWLKKKW